MKEVDLSYTGLKENIHLISYLAHLTPIRAIVKTLDNIEQYVFKSQKDIDNTLRNLTIPNLVIGGKKDTVVPVKYSKLIKKLDKRAKLKILPGADHRVIINDPSEIEEIMYFFLKHKTNKRKFVEELNIHKKRKKKQ